MGIAVRLRRATAVLNNPYLGAKVLFLPTPDARLKPRSTCDGSASANGVSAQKCLAR